MNRLDPKNRVALFQRLIVVLAEGGERIMKGQPLQVSKRAQVGRVSLSRQRTRLTHDLNSALSGRDHLPATVSLAPLPFNESTGRQVVNKGNSGALVHMQPVSQVLLPQLALFAQHLQRHELTGVEIERTKRCLRRSDDVVTQLPKKCHHFGVDLLVVQYSAI